MHGVSVAAHLMLLFFSLRPCVFCGLETLQLHRNRADNSNESIDQEKPLFTRAMRSRLRQAGVFPGSCAEVFLGSV